MKKDARESTHAQKHKRERRQTHLLFKRAPIALRLALRSVCALHAFEHLRRLLVLLRARNPVRHCQLQQPPRVRRRARPLAQTLARARAPKERLDVRRSHRERGVAGGTRGRGRVEPQQALGAVGVQCRARVGIRIGRARAAAARGQDAQGGVIARERLAELLRGKVAIAVGARGREIGTGSRRHAQK